MRNARGVTETPEWYWPDGLHDARIGAVALYENPTDWKTKTSRQTVMEMLLDSRQALFTQNIRKVTLLDARIISGKPEALAQCYWQSEAFERLENGRYRLKIEAKSAEDETIDVCVEFSHAETERDM